MTQKPTYALIALSVMLFFLLTFISGFYFGFNARVVVVPEISPVINVSCPRDIINTTLKCPSSQTIVNTPRYTYIKPTYYDDLEFDFEGGVFSLKGVDDYGRITGSSMNPTLWTGNTLINVDYIGQELKEGQIIQYRSGGTIFIHRINGVYSNEVYVQWDNYNDELEAVPLEDIMSLVVGVIYTK